MSSDNPIIHLGELSKPATVLIEKISDAVGGLFKPYQIVRVAKAEAEAERVRAESQIEISDLQRRAFYRFLEEEAKKQKNIEEITRMALPQLGDKSKPEEVEDDWITNFFDKCRLISDAEMQSLWSRVLAGEANAPGSYSKRTVNFLSSLDRTDAQLFTNLCKFGWIIGGLVPLIYDVQNVIYNKWGTNFGSLQHLDTIGLIQFDSLAGYRRMGLPKRFAVSYYGKLTLIELSKESENEMNLGHVLLTKIGQELARICGSQPDEEFQEYILNKWKEMGYIKEEKAEPPSTANG
jgi:Protein of unknown function (DUF2806)